MFIEMEEEIIKPEKTESPKSTDRVSHRETISSLEQNKDHTQALESNPDQFPSIANLRIPNADQIEPFQIVDGDKQIAASRKIEQAGSNTFHDGLKALGTDATEEDKARYQIDYMNRKAEVEYNPSPIMFKLNAEYTDIQVTPGIQNIDDARRFLGAMGETLQHDALNMLNHLAEPNAVNNDIIASIQFLSKDNSEFNKQLIATGEAVLEKLSKPMTPEETAIEALHMAPIYVRWEKQTITRAVACERSGLTFAEIKAMDPEILWHDYGLAHLPRGYRAAFFKEFPSLKSLSKKLEVHHELPQRTLKEDLFHPAEINDPHVMKGVTKEVHEAITTEWERFFFLNPNANRRAIIDQMQFIRNKYRSEMLP